MKKKGDDCRLSKRVLLWIDLFSFKGLGFSIQFDSSRFCYFGSIILLFANRKQHNVSVLLIKGRCKERRERGRKEESEGE